MSHYIHAGIFFICCLAISLVMISIPLIRAKSRFLKTKEAQYECGFKPFSNKIKSFDVKFILVAILFIVFDIEIVILIPWALNIKALSGNAMFSVCSFLVTLTVGLLYEWKKGLIDWM